MTQVLRYADAPTRRDWIVEQLRATGFLSVSRVADELGVSDMTVRRDLRLLEADGEVVMVHGGLRLPHAHLRSSEFVSRARSESAAKMQIAAHVCAGIGERESVALDAGTTTYPVALGLPTEFHGAVVTPSVPVIHALLGRHDLRVVGLGGDLHHASQAFVGPTAVEAVRRLRVRTTFLAAAAVDERGIYVQADVERPTKLAMMEIADQVVLLADHSKLTGSAPVQLCSLDRLDRLVTDRPLTLPVARAMAAAGVTVEVAAPGPVD